VSESDGEQACWWGRRQEKRGGIVKQRLVFLRGGNKTIADLYDFLSDKCLGLPLCLLEQCPTCCFLGIPSGCKYVGSDVLNVVVGLV
jgi:hypothetical protein